MTLAASPAAPCQAKAGRLPGSQSTMGKQSRLCCSGSKDAHQSESGKRSKRLQNNCRPWIITNLIMHSQNHDEWSKLFELAVLRSWFFVFFSSLICRFGVDVHDFGKSWRSGLAFLAMIKSINPALVDLRESMHREPSENLQLAFSIAHHSLDIAPLLEPEGKSLQNTKCLSPLDLNSRNQCTHAKQVLESQHGVKI